MLELIALWIVITAAIAALVIGVLIGRAIYRDRKRNLRRLHKMNRQNIWALLVTSERRDS